MCRDNGVGSMNYHRKVNASLYATIFYNLFYMQFQKLINLNLKHNYTYECFLVSSKLSILINLNPYITSSIHHNSPTVKHVNQFTSPLFFGNYINCLMTPVRCD